MAPSKPADAGQSEAQRIQVWRTILQGKDPRIAYDLVVSEDSVAVDTSTPRQKQPPEQVVVQRKHGGGMGGRGGGMEGSGYRR